jgi:hypothetical protein
MHTYIHIYIWDTGLSLSSPRGENGRAELKPSPHKFLTRNSNRDSEEEEEEEEEEGEGEGVDVQSVSPSNIVDKGARRSSAKAVLKLKLKEEEEEEEEDDEGSDASYQPHSGSRYCCICVPRTVCPRTTSVVRELS